jgi:Transposase DDE domain
MQPKYDILQENEQEAKIASQELVQLLEKFLSPLLLVLDTFLDKRLVRTLVQVCVAILRFRNNKQGLLLSELGSYLPSYPGQATTATAGTKRIGNLIRSLKWSILQIDRYLIDEADKEVKKLKEQGKRILCIWDESVLEKPESEKLEGLCPVVSSKAKRLHRSKKGLVFNFPPKKAITVTGMEWTGALITGMEGMIKIAVMSWWTTKGDEARKLREQQEILLRKVFRQWGSQLLHIFDRGAASGPWIKVLQQLGIRFVIRWKKGHYFFNAKGEKKKLWQIGLGKKYLSHKGIRDTHTGEKMPCDIWWAQIWHEQYTYQLYLVKVRVKKKVWYLVTNERIRTADQAWDIVFAYKRRWQIELSFRYGKSELAMECPRLYSLENRLKLLGIVTLVYAFLLHLLAPTYRELVEKVLQLKCRRTGKQYQKALAPLYRLRWAISRLWDG